ncbi:MAG: M24 family metallopeptidase [Planctomycetales bacterium]|nr:M24 family metallopeptidase [Planctomycetales bacterium]
MFDLAQVQSAIGRFGFNGWLLYDFRRSNVLACRVAGLPEDSSFSRRWFYFIPASGEPVRLVHRIETGVLDHLPGEKRVYLRWQELEAELARMLQGQGKIAMEYAPRGGNPYVSRVDGGTIEQVRATGVEVGSSGDLIQFFEARWTPEQWAMHLEADKLNQQAFDLAWEFIASSTRAGKILRETDVQDFIMDHFERNNLTTYHPPIVGVNAHAGDPHYAPVRGADSEIREGDFVLIDLWSKLKRTGAVYSDLTKVGFMGSEVPERFEQVFGIVAAARDASIQLVRDAMAAGRELQGWEVDQAARDVIEAAGYGDAYIHRTGHNIGQETHGNGAHMDNLETREERLVLPETCFSIEPGIYLPEFGARSEVDVFVDADRQVHVTGGLQHKVLPILA